MSVSRSDALVFFGVTGDLAYKISPALQAMVMRGHRNVRVIAVARRHGISLSL